MTTGRINQIAIGQGPRGTKRPGLHVYSNSPTQNREIHRQLVYLACGRAEPNETLRARSCTLSTRRATRPAIAESRRRPWRDAGRNDSPIGVPCGPDLTGQYRMRIETLRAGRQRSAGSTTLRHAPTPSEASWPVMVKIAAPYEAPLRDGEFRLERV